MSTQAEHFHLTRISVRISVCRIIRATRTQFDQVLRDQAMSYISHRHNRFHFISTNVVAWGLHFLDNKSTNYKFAAFRTLDIYTLNSWTSTRSTVKSLLFGDCGHLWMAAISTYNSFDRAMGYGQSSKLTGWSSQNRISTQRFIHAKYSRRYLRGIF